MPEFTSEGKERRRNLGCTIFGWLVFILVLGATLVVGQKAFVYYGKIKRGEIVDLPQFHTKLTTSKKMTLNQPTVDRALIEGDDAPATGASPSTAQVTIVEFGDFECPFSKDEYPVVGQMIAKYGDRVRFIFHNYPLQDVHVHAKDAALASLCAQEQGKFWPFYERLFQNAPALALGDLSNYAEGAGLNPKQFEKCLDDRRYASKIDKEIALAERVGVAGTPVFFFNGQRVEGAIPVDVFETIIRRLMSAK